MRYYIEALVIIVLTVLLQLTGLAVMDSFGITPNFVNPGPLVEYYTVVGTISTLDSSDPANAS